MRELRNSQGQIVSPNTGRTAQEIRDEVKRRAEAGLRLGAFHNAEIKPGVYVTGSIMRKDAKP